jgi:hypothetical protein
MGKDDGGDMIRSSQKMSEAHHCTAVQVEGAVPVTLQTNISLPRPHEK